jgi:ABC-type branched-subunit amino acid transport system permease subunit
VLSFPLRNDYWGAVGLNVVFYVLMALSVLFITGLTGEPSLMQMAFAGIGAYSVAYCLGQGLPFAVGVLVGMGVSFVIALAVGWAALRFRGVAFAVFSLAIGAPISTYLLGQRWLRNDVQAPRLFGLDLLSARTAFAIFAVATGLLLLLVRGLLRSSWGRSMRAVEDGHPEILRHAGVSPTRTEVVVFGFSGAVAALAGAVYALIVGSFTTFQFIPLVSISILLAGFIGGLRSLWGPIITGVIFGYGPVVLSSFGSERANAYPQIVGSALALVLVVWAPNGLSSIFGEAQDAVSRRQRWTGGFRGPRLSLAVSPQGQEVSG